MSDLLGSLVGGMEIEGREALYGDFINECSARVLDAFDHHLEKPEPCSTVTRCSIAFAFVPLMSYWQRRKESCTS
jgi:hypothetical protein